MNHTVHPQKIGFAQSLVDPVLDGSKTLTYRLGSKFADSLEKGQVIEAENSATGEIFAQIKVTKVGLFKISEIQLDQKGHEKYESLNQLIASMQKHYPQINVTEDSLVSMIEFELL